MKQTRFHIEYTISPCISVFDEICVQTVMISFLYDFIVKHTNMCLTKINKPILAKNFDKEGNSSFIGIPNNTDHTI